MMAAHRRSRGRRYRGQHRQDGHRYTPADLIITVTTDAEDTRRAHIASLRHLSPGMIYLGAELLNLKFWGVVPPRTDPQQITGTLTITQPQAPTSAPVIDWPTWAEPGDVIEVSGV